MLVLGLLLPLKNFQSACGNYKQYFFESPFYGGFMRVFYAETGPCVALKLSSPMLNTVQENTNTMCYVCQFIFGPQSKRKGPFTCAYDGAGPNNKSHKSH